MKKIAVIDDEPALLRVCLKMLEAGGYECLAFDQAKAALDALRSEAVDLVITDIYMPGMNGFQFMEELRAMLPTVPIIAISGGGKLSQTDVLEDTQDFGATAILHKPFRREQLLMVVEKTLASS